MPGTAASAPATTETLARPDYPCNFKSGSTDVTEGTDTSHTPPVGASSVLEPVRGTVYAGSTFSLLCHQASGMVLLREPLPIAPQLTLLHR